MSYSPLALEGFGGGLNLRDKADVVDPSQAIDGLNFILSERGAVGQRDGYTNLTSVALTNRAASLEPFYTSAGTKQLLAGCGTRLEAVDTAGAVVASASGLTNAVWDFARVATPGNETAYAGNGTDTLRKWSGAAWSTPTATVNGVAALAMPKAGSICIEPGDARMVATRFSTATGGPNGATSSPSHVYFSEPGDPETWLTTTGAGGANFVQLTPGDGESIQAAIAWREFVFVFKESRYFVFYGTGLDSNGRPEFRFRPIEAGVGLASPRAVCAGPDGVYFMSRDGVYRTTGQEPELVSSLVEPIWRGNAHAFYLGGVLDHTQIANCAMTWHDRRIYLSYSHTGVTANDRTLVYDPAFKFWALWDTPAAALASFRIGGQPELVMARASGSNHIDRSNSALTNDAGVAITSRWRSGFFDGGDVARKTIRESKFWGTGKVFMGVADDFDQNAAGVQGLRALDFTPPGLVTWNTNTWNISHWVDSVPGLVPAISRVAYRGTTFSTYFENSVLNQTWSIHRGSHHFRGPRRRPSDLRND